MNARNKHGQALGRKGAESRQRLLDAAKDLLVRAPTQKLTASAVAREAGMASQTFYLYFAEMGELLLDLSKDASEDMAEVLDTLNCPWDVDSLRLHSQRFVDAFSRYWNRHREVLSIRNFQSDLGAEAFAQVRQDAGLQVVRAIAERIRAAHGADRLSRTDALARGVIIFAAIERLAARPATTQMEPSLLNAADVLRAEADILTLLFTPPNVGGADQGEDRARPAQAEPAPTRVRRAETARRRTTRPKLPDR
jgi:AcrR family transcriptional regulator